MVYWVHILGNWHTDLPHTLYRKYRTDLTPRLFSRLEETVPGLGEQVFEGLRACIQCYFELCMDRTPIEWKGREKIVCKSIGWNRIGYEHDAYERPWRVLEAVRELV